MCKQHITTTYSQHPPLLPIDCMETSNGQGWKEKQLFHTVVHILQMASSDPPHLPPTSQSSLAKSPWQNPYRKGAQLCTLTVICKTCCPHIPKGPTSSLGPPVRFIPPLLSSVLPERAAKLPNSWVVSASVASPVPPPFSVVLHACRGCQLLLVLAASTGTQFLCDAEAPATAKEEEEEELAP